MLEKYALLVCLKEVLGNPHTSFSVKELAKRTKLSSGAARLSLSYMHQKGIVFFQIVGNTHQYKANLENPLSRQWKVLFNVNEITEAKLLGELQQQIPKIQCIMLYGSMARGTNDKKSDADFLVVANQSTKVTFNFGKKFSHEVNLLILSWADWKKKAVNEKAFYDSVIFDAIMLYGDRPVVT